MTTLNRRTFLQSTALAAGGFALNASLAPKAAFAADKPLYQISLAEWSLHRTLSRGGDGKDNLKFPVMAKNDFGIDAIEYVNQFFRDQAGNEKYLAELKKICESEGVKSLLIMCDGLGALGDPNEAKRKRAVENHHPWVQAAKYLGCHSIRVNAASSGSYEEQQKLAADGLRQLSEYGDQHDINVIVENHGGLSSNGQWLAGVMKMVDHQRVGTLPDFGNFHGYDRYKGTRELMPYAKGVSAKSHKFDEQGNETRTDYLKMMKIVLDAGYRGHVGVEWEGGGVSEPEGIKLTRDLLLRVREKLAPAYA